MMFFIETNSSKNEPFRMFMAFAECLSETIYQEQMFTIQGECLRKTKVHQLRIPPLNIAICRYTELHFTIAEFRILPNVLCMDFR